MTDKRNAQPQHAFAPSPGGYRPPARAREHPHPLSRRIAHVLALQPDSAALEFDEHWYSWGRIGGLTQRLGTIIESDSGPRPVGILLRNRPEHVAALLAVLLAGDSVVVINPSRGDDRTRDDIAALRLPLLIGAPGDLDSLVVPVPETTIVSIPGPDALPEVRNTATTQHTESSRPGVAVRMLTSGTTGPPKRVDISYDMLARSVMGTDPAAADAPARPRKGVAVVNAPLVHIGGVFRVLQCVTEARPFVLLPRFELKSWVRAVRAHRPGAVSLVPAALRMVLHSELRREDLAGIRVVTSGTAPLSADDADAFYEKFGIPVLTSYAATEFGGGVAGWTLPDHERYWTAKRGSVGRATGGARLRVVDEHGTVLGAGEAGLLEVIPGQLGPGADWVRTTDLARIDDDGFLWILGRADQAIIRGGFKIMPEDVRGALESHPAVRGAAVVGRADPRLRETPVAMVELHPDADASPGALTTFLQSRLARYEIPVELAVVAAIPRTPSGKPDLRAVRSHFETTVSQGRPSANTTATVHPADGKSGQSTEDKPSGPARQVPADLPEHASIDLTEHRTADTSEHRTADPTGHDPAASTGHATIGRAEHGPADLTDHETADALPGEGENPPNTTGHVVADHVFPGHDQVGHTAAGYGDPSRVRQADLDGGDRAGR